MTVSTQPPPKFTTQAAYARLKGWDKSRITRLKEAGMVVFNDQGEVDVSATDRVIGDNQHPALEAVRQYHAQKRAAKVEIEQKLATVGLTAAKGANQATGSDRAVEAAFVIRGHIEKEKLIALKRDNAIASGDLAPIDDIRQKFLAHSRLLRLEAEVLVKNLTVELGLTGDKKRQIDDVFDEWLRSTHVKLQTLASDARKVG
jgi:hypothetical protein